MDRPFVFRLERVRRVRERTEELARSEFATSLEAREDGRRTLAGAAAQADDARAGHLRLVADADGRELRAAQAYIERTEAQRRMAAADLGRREAELEARRAALQRAARDREALERLRERRREAHVRESQRRGAAVLDELALTMHRRRTGS